jgi:prolyl 4-hydroxylase
MDDRDVVDYGDDSNMELKVKSTEDTDSEDEGDNEDNEEDDPDVVDDDNNNGPDIDVPFWKQHSVAIAIALVASIAGHWYSQQQQQQYRDSSPSLTSFSSLFSFRPLEDSMERHNHLDGFVRTANISFCQSLPESSEQSDRLRLMEFYFPREYFNTLEAFYVADHNEDDTYQEIPSTRSQSQGDPGLALDDPEYQCLLDQHLNKPTSIKFKGTTYYFKNPSMEEIYPELASTALATTTPTSSKSIDPAKERQRRLQQPPLTFTGFAAKFVNMSPKPVLLYWDGKGGREESKRLVGEIPPFESVGTATMPGQSFHVTPIYDPSTALQRWVLTADTALVYYEPTPPMEMKRTLGVEDPKAYAMYQRQLVNQAFARDYTVVSGRTWLGHFPRRFPMHYMHPASHIGQEHVMGDGGMTLKVVSVTPRVFVIDNFLTPQDCQEIIRLGSEQGLALSTLHNSASARQTRDTSTRSSSNAWLPWDASPVTEKVYERAAQVTKIDPELFRKFHETNAHHHSIAESLQVVRYKRGEEYTPHHDFVSPPINDRFQPTRFATLLIYLNTVPEGGETRFPRAVNNFNGQGLEISPKIGTAVLFYNMLEDGNLDDLSQHGGNKVTDKTKWLANLWVSPYFAGFGHSTTFSCHSFIRCCRCCFFTDVEWGALSFYHNWSYLSFGVDRSGTRLLDDPIFLRGYTVGNANVVFIKRQGNSLN